MHWQTELVGKYEGFAQLLLLNYPIVLFIIGKGTRNNKVCMGTYVGVATKVLRSRDIKRYLFSEIWCLLACCGHTQSIFLTKFVHIRFMSVIPSYLYEKVLFLVDQMTVSGRFLTKQDIWRRLRDVWRTMSSLGQGIQDR